MAKISPRGMMATAGWSRTESPLPAGSLSASRSLATARSTSSGRPRRHPKAEARARQQRLFHYGHITRSKFSIRIKTRLTSTAKQRDLQADATDGQRDAKAGRMEHLRHVFDPTAVQRRRFRQVTSLYHGTSQRGADAQPLRARGRHALQPSAIVHQARRQIADFTPGSWQPRTVSQHLGPRDQAALWASE